MIIPMTELALNSLRVAAAPHGSTLVVNDAIALANVEGIVYVITGEHFTSMTDEQFNDYIMTHQSV